METKPEIVISGFSERFSHFLKKSKLNPNSLAVKMCETGDLEEIKKLGVRYGRWLNRKATPSYDNLVEIAMKFGIDMNWFMLGIESKPTAPNGISNIDYKTLYEDEREETIRLRKINERLSMSILENSGLLTDKEGSKIESSDRTTVEMLILNPAATQVYGLIRYEQPGDQAIDDFLDEVTAS